jgi:hypothetical protein
MAEQVSMQHENVIPVLGHNDRRDAPGGGGQTTNPEHDECYYIVMQMMMGDLSRSPIKMLTSTYHHAQFVSTYHDAL